MKLCTAARPAEAPGAPASAGRAVGYCYHCRAWASGRLHSAVGDQYVYITGHPGCPGSEHERRRP